jgi:anti-sigma factor RsiW
VPPETLPAHLRTRIDKTIGLKRASVRPTWQALAASVVLALAIGSASTWFVTQPQPDDRIVTKLVDSHIRALMASQVTDVTSSERHTVKPWFNGRLPGSPIVVDLASEGFPLVGGRIDVIDTVPTATLVYGRRQHLISVFAVPDTTADAATGSRTPINGYNIVVWRKNDKTYGAVSDLNAAELESFAQKFRAAS